MTFHNTDSTKTCRNVYGRHGKLEREDENTPKLIEDLVGEKVKRVHVDGITPFSAKTMIMCIGLVYRFSSGEDKN